MSGWYSGDHHIHAAGCRHYQNPAEGVLPDDMMRQVRGERINVSSVLTWGPDYYYQKQFFSGHDHPLSTKRQLSITTLRSQVFHRVTPDISCC
jgi:hypothetical protein